MSWLSKLFGTENPAKSAMPYLNQIPGVAHQYFDPYVQQGQQAYGNIAPEFQDMVKSPTDYLEKILADYQPSRAYQLKRDEALRAAGNTAAAGGMRGSGQDQILGGRLADSLLGEDMQQWLNNVLGIQKTGLAGEEDIYSKGFQGSGQLESELANALAQQGNLAYQGTAEKNRRTSDLWKGALNAAGAIAGMPTSGGGSLGGDFMKRWL